MISHVLPQGMFTAPFISFMVDRFAAAEHRFIIMGSDLQHDSDYKSTADVSFLTLRRGLGGRIRFARDMDRHLAESRLIIFHSLPTGMLTEYLTVRPGVVRRSTWAVWGGDLQEKIVVAQASTGFRLRQTAMRRVLGRLRGGLSLTSGDATRIRDYLGAPLPVLPIRYLNPITAGDLDAAAKEATGFPTHSTVRVLLGNSATPSNRHALALNLLSRFAEEDIEIFVPLGYGSETYATEICTLGNDIFGSKFKPMRSFLSPRDFAVVLADMDIALFAHNRQQGLGTIYAAAYLGKKIYSSRENASWKDLSDQLPVVATECVEYMDFHAFREQSRARHEEMTECAKYLFDERVTAAMWERVFALAR